MTIKKLDVFLTFSGFFVDKPVREHHSFDAEQVVLTIPVETSDSSQPILKNYKLWELFHVVLKENPNVPFFKETLIDSWIHDKVLQKHPQKNRLLQVEWKLYDELNRPINTKLEELLDFL